MEHYTWNVFVNTGRRERMEGIKRSAMYVLRP